MRKVLIVSGIVISLIAFSFVLLTNNKLNEENEKIVDNTDGMISYTIDGEIAKEQPSRENGYIVNKIECKNGSILVWDNDNWQVELVDIKGSDRCMIDFTKDTSKPGYRITVTSNSPSSLDSTSKTTTNGGVVTIYPNDSTIFSVTGCSGVLEDNKVIVRNVVENQTCNITVKQTLADVILSKYENVTERTDFSIMEKQSKLWKTTDYNSSGNFVGTSYYYTGNPDNWLSFAGVLWRIIRINGDGSVRLLYTGDGFNIYLTPDDITNEIEVGMDENGKIVYNNYDTRNPIFAGWRYGTSGSLENNRTNENKSNVYQVVENWYQNNIVNKGLENYISKTAIYCNDRSIGEGIYTTSISQNFYYSGSTRLITNKTPTLECININDQFKDGFGLMTADELSFAGGLYLHSNTGTYYSFYKDGKNITNGHWWTMTPRAWDGGGNSIFRLNVFVINSDWSYVTANVRPVISLSSNAIYLEGDGTSSNPYKIVIE